MIAEKWKRLLKEAVGFFFWSVVAILIIGLYLFVGYALYFEGGFEKVIEGVGYTMIGLAIVLAIRS